MPKQGGHPHYHTKIRYLFGMMWFGDTLNGAVLWFNLNVSMALVLVCIDLAIAWTLC